MYLNLHFRGPTTPESIGTASGSLRRDYEHPLKYVPAFFPNMYTNTVCPRSSDPLCGITYYIK